MPMFPDPAAAPFRPEHAVLRGEVRAWVAEHIVPFAAEWEQAREFPRSLFTAAGAAGILGWKYGPEDGGRGPDLLADVVVSEELTRCGSGGVAAGLGATKDLAPFYVARFGSGDQRARWLRPQSRVGRLRRLPSPSRRPVPMSRASAAERLPTVRVDGRSTGRSASSRTGAGPTGCSSRRAAPTSPAGEGCRCSSWRTSAPGFTADRIATLGWRTSQTGLLHLDGVRVDRDALVGDAGDGFVMIMKSFQWERLCMAIAAVAGAAASLERVAEWSTTQPAATTSPLASPMSDGGSSRVRLPRRGRLRMPRWWTSSPVETSCLRCRPPSCSRATSPSPRRTTC